MSIDTTADALDVVHDALQMCLKALANTNELVRRPADRGAWAALHETFEHLVESAGIGVEVCESALNDFEL